MRIHSIRFALRDLEEFRLEAIDLTQVAGVANRALRRVGWEPMRRRRRRSVHAVAHQGPEGLCIVCSWNAATEPDDRDRFAQRTLGLRQARLGRLQGEEGTVARRVVLALQSEAEGLAAERQARLDALTAPNGGGVFVSLWEAWQGQEYSFYSQAFTSNPGFPSLAVNGAFDHTSYPDTTPAADRYLLDNLEDRLLYGP